MKKKAGNPLISEKWINKKTGVEVKADTHSDGDVEVTISGPNGMEQNTLYSFSDAARGADTISRFMAKKEDFRTEDEHQKEVLQDELNTLIKNVTKLSTKED